MQVTMVIFDKTGTLTVGRPTVTHVVVNLELPPSEVSQDLVVEVAGAVERGSEHPLGKSIRTFAETRFGASSLPEATEFEVFAGNGVRAKVSALPGVQCTRGAGFTTWVSVCGRGRPTALTHALAHSPACRYVAKRR